MRFCHTVVVLADSLVEPEPADEVREAEEGEIGENGGERVRGL